jgi:hypothetical protein
MNEQQLAAWEVQIRAAAQTLAYPPTPDIAGAVRARLEASSRRPPSRLRLAWAVALVVLVLGGMLAVPQVRAAVVEVLRIGVVQIFLGPATPTTPPTLSPAGGAAGPELPSTATPRPLPTPLASVLNLAGETTLAEARTASGLAIPLPAYPPGLGDPDHVFLQDQNGPVVVLVWLDPSDARRIRMSLHVLAAGTWGVGKLQPTVVQETTVGGRPAVWTEGPYLMFAGPQAEPSEIRLIEGHVLIWVDDQVTFRLESDLPLEEAVRVAEALR